MSRAAALLVLLVSLGTARALASPTANGSAPAFPPALASYTGEEGLGLVDVLVSRARAEPLNAIATGIFLLALLHTFLAPRFLALSHRLQAKKGEELSFRAEILHFFGEVEAVFGIWALPLVGVITFSKGWKTTEAFLAHGVNFTEAVFVVVIMAIASTRPVLRFAESAVGLLAALGKRSPLAWWLSILTAGPLLGSFITEPAAMIICALLLGRQLYDLDPSPRLRYATLGLLFVNVSVGGTLTHFAAPPVLMVAGRWGWDTRFMLTHFGWKAVVGIVLSNALYAAFFWKELRDLKRQALERVEPDTTGPLTRIPIWVTGTHLAFLGFTVFSGHTPAIFVGAFLFFLAFSQATAPYQSPIDLKPPLLVGFFLAGLVVHGTLQQWWIAPVLGRLSAFPLMLGATFLTAFNDNAAITYLASLVPGFSDAMKHAVVMGAVTGGGLTVIANAPNPAGQAILARYFPDGISPAGLFLGAAIPTLVVGTVLFMLP